MKILSGHVLRDHVILGGIAAFVCVPFWGMGNSLGFWFANILIDSDHYLHFIWLTRLKVTGFKAMLKFHEMLFSMRNHPDFISVEVFHTAEFMGVLAALSFLFPQFFKPVFLGCLFHIVVDFFHLFRFHILTKRAHSLVEYFLRKKRIIAKGGNPSALVAQLLEQQFS